MRFLPWTLSLIVTVHAGAALADEFPFRLPETTPRDKTPEVTTLRSVHLRNQGVREQTADPTPSRERFRHFDTTKGGFKFQDSFALGGRSYSYSVRGPVQKERRLGLTFELRF